MTARTQVLLEPQHQARLRRIASKRGVSVGTIVREAIEAYLNGQRTRSKAEALASLESLEAPVDDWEVMKAEILQGATI